MDRSHPMKGEMTRCDTLSAADAVQALLWKARQHAELCREVEPAVHGMNRRNLRVTREGKRQPIDMGVNQIELRAERIHFVEHRDFEEESVTRTGQPPASRCHWPESRTRQGITAREQRDLVPSTNEFLGKRMNDALCPPVPNGWDSLRKRSHLCDSHSSHPYLACEISRPAYH